MKDKKTKEEIVDELMRMEYDRYQSIETASIKIVMISTSIISVLTIIALFLQKL